MLFTAILTCTLAANIGLAAQTSQAPATSSSKTAPRSSMKKTGTSATHTAAAGQPTAIFDTTAGKWSCKLYQKQAPNTVANFIGLATGKKDWTDPKTNQSKHGVPLYAGTIFHRVIPNFMIQGGDPLGSGMGGPGYKFNDEFSPELHFDKPGVLAMANSGPNTNGSQFFITEVPYPFLDPCLDEGGCTRGNRPVPKGYGYTIFGQCDGPAVEAVKKIARMPSSPDNNRPLDPVKINHISITGTGGAAKPAIKRPGTTKRTPSTRPRATAPQAQNQ